jgi:glycosyltransferase involved in cell wall biosynthesis
MRPPISALLPIRDGERWIESSILNINQVLTSKDELLIINDGSKDNTVEIIKECNIIPNLRLISSPGLGLVNALNTGVTEAKNQWIARFDVDDIYDSRRIDLQMTDIPLEVVAIFTDFEMYSDNGEYLGYFPSPLSDFAILLSLARSERNAHPSVVFRKESVLKVGGYREEDFPCEDLSLWLRLAKVGKLHGIAYPALKYTLRADSVSSTRYLEAKIKTKQIFNSLFDLESHDQFLLFWQTLKLYKKSALGLQRKAYLLRDAIGSQVWVHLETKVKFLMIFFAIQMSLNPKTYLLLFRESKLRTERKRMRKV